MKNSPALITTVIPTYKRPLLLKRSIMSVLSQTLPNLEVLVCDNASNDETETIVRQIMQKDSRIKYHKHSKNIGSYPNFNYGIQSVNTPFFSLLSDDDLLAPDFYEKALAAFEKFPEAMFSCMPTMVIDVENNVVSPPVKVPATRLYKPEDSFSLEINRPIPEAWTGIIFRTQIRDEIGLINIEAGPFADGGFVMHATARFPFVETPGLGGILMAHQASTSGTTGVLSKEWLIWQEQMTADIVNDPKISDAVKQRVKGYVIQNYKKIAFYQINKALIVHNFEFAERAAIGLKECGHPLISWLLQRLIWAYKTIPLLRKILLQFRKRKKDNMEKTKVKLNAQYRDSLSFITRL